MIDTTNTLPKFRFEIFPKRGLRGKRWYFRIVARNNEIVAQSEGLKNKADAIHMVDRLRLNIAHASVTVYEKDERK